MEQQLRHQCSPHKSELENVLKTDTPQRAFTVRRNPIRRVRLQTPAVGLLNDPTSAITSTAPIPFHIDDDPSDQEKTLPVSETLKVFLRIRPLNVKGRPASKNVRGSGEDRGKVNMARKSQEVCLVVNNTSSVTLRTPASSLDVKRPKCEIYEGFTHVFPPESRQREVYERVMSPLVKDFMEGKSGLLAAMGPSGSGKTHTMFGCPRDPGIVSLALQHLFRDDGVDAKNKIGSTCVMRSYYLSMFEICSTCGKQERIFDLSSSGADLSELSLSRSSIEGLHEVMVSSLVDAECVIARGMLRRATAKTYANDQSSRSQCVINIRNCSKSTTPNSDNASSTVLTIVDLAGAERERGNISQKTRLVERSFINNTSMVFGHCLRSLLEYQRNPKMPLQKHFQNSLLTKYLREYFEGRKRLSLMLTAKSGEDDYLSTSFLLRQASPFMKIKFTAVEELPNQKRPAILKSNPQPAKRRKNYDSKVDEIKIDNSRSPVTKKETEQGCEDNTCADAISTSNTFREDNTIVSHNEECPVSQKPTRNEEVMILFSRAVWKLVKDYKQKLKVSEDEVKKLKESLADKHTQVILLEQELKDLLSLSFEHQFPLPGSSNPKMNMVSLDDANLTLEQPKEDAENNIKGDYCANLTEEEIDLKSHHFEKSDLGLATIASVNRQQNLDLAHREDIFPDQEFDFKQDPVFTEADAQKQPSFSEISPKQNLSGSGNQQDYLLSPQSNVTSADQENITPSLQSNLSKYGKKHFPTLELPVSKPRRKLLPASALLLKEFAQLDLDGANAKETQERVKERQRSQGSIALVRLLRGNLPK